jgi:filamentous hemagglutinin family protein
MSHDACAASEKFTQAYAAQANRREAVQAESSLRPNPSPDSCRFCGELRPVRPADIVARGAWLAGVSMIALLVGTSNAHARPLGGWAPTPSAAALAASQAASQQAQQAAAQASNSLKRATQAIQAMQAAQNAARAAAAGAGHSAMLQVNVPNGLGQGGLQVGPGTWEGANAPTQSVSNGQTNVDINQTAAQAILSWTTFNVGAQTTLTFDQHGNSNWVALNRVVGNLGPSQILGNIKADGQVYVINQNGVIFGGASQINVGSLIASSANITDQQFLANGIYSTQSGGTYTPSFTGASGKIVVENGALITTNAPSSVTSGGGFVLLMGSEVDNAGMIQTPSGQTELAAGQDFILRPGYGTDANQTSTTRGNEIATGTWTVDGSGNGTWTVGGGTVDNTGLIFSQQGDITLAGHAVIQDGILLSTTSVDQRGTIHLLNSATDTAGSVTLTGNAITTILPETDSTETALNSQRDGLIAASGLNSLATGQFDDLSTLADREDLSRVEIVSGNLVNFESGSLTMAQGGQVFVSAGNRVFAATGSTIDVSGTTNTVLPMSANNVEVNIQGNELRDSPDNRDSGDLANANVWIDARDLVLVPAGTGGYTTDRYYTPGGLLEVSGYLSNTGHTIGEWTALGGTVTLSAPQVVAQTGSTFNISGDAVSYAGGYILTTNFVSSDGQVYSIDDAPGGILYDGIAGGYTRKNAHWNISQTWTSILSRGSVTARWEDGYTIGRDAGQLILSTPTSLFQGDIDADVITGSRQTSARPSSVTDGYKVTQDTAPLPGTLALGAYGATGLANGADTSVVFGSGPGVDSSGMSATAALPADVANTAYFDVNQINADHLGGLKVASTDSITVGAPLVFAPGAQVTFVAPIVDIKANITAHAGNVTATNILTPDQSGSTPIELTTPAGVTQLTLESGATIDTSGVWTNGLLDPNDLGGLAYVNGGSVTFDSTQGVTLASGSTINVSSGAAVLPTGKTVGGKGGNVTLVADYPLIGADHVGTLVLDGTLVAYGVNGGGTLTLAASSVLIGDGLTSTAPDQIVLPTSFFAQGFSDYDITGYAGVTVAQDAQVNVVEPVYQFTDASFTAPTGSDPSSVLSVWTPPLYIENPLQDQLIQRAGASLALHGGSLNSGGPVTIGSGALLAVDPLQSIRIDSADQIIVDGTLRAPGGSISIVYNGTNGALNGQSIWIGDDATLDVAGRAYVATDSRGETYGTVSNGGSIILGTDATGFDSTGSILSADTFIIIRPGALLDASGTSATLDIPTRSGLAPSSTPLFVASDGGSITLTSYDGIYADGTLRAAAGGAGAAGGTLTVILDTPTYNANNVSASQLVPRVITITQDADGPQLSANLTPGTSDPSLQFGQAQFSADTLAAGGFGNLSFSGRDAILFSGDVTLSAQQSIAFHEGALADTSTTATVNIIAPYVVLDGQTGYTVNGGQARPAIWGGADWTASTQTSTGTFTVSASLIDVSNDVVFGVSDNATAFNGNTYQGTQIAYDFAGFGTINLSSQGDMRFIGAQSRTFLAISDNVLSLTAAQIYPVNTLPADAQGNITKASVQIFAGSTGGLNPDGVININRIDGVDPAAPDSVGGSLVFIAATINQGGIVRAPFGQITFQSASALDLLPGSITSVSGNGLIIPYGGTADGVTYTYDGATYGTSQSGNVGIVAGTISLTGPSIHVQSGAVLDVSGGGTLAGAGFVTGRGGSVDVLTTPLVNANPTSTFSSSGDQVYAIIPSYQSGYAPLGPTAGAQPGIGQQITIPAGVPGLPAGTYTLLPARYALMPGAYRVELGKTETGSQAVQGATSVGNGSYVVDGYRGIANTGVKNALATEAIVTSGAAVRGYSQYNETSFSDFLLQTAASLGQARPALPADAGSMLFGFNGSGSFDFSFNGTALFQPAAGGFGGSATFSSSGPMEVVNGTATPGFTGLSLDVSELNAIGANILTLSDASLFIRGGVVLSAAPEIALVAEGSDGAGIVLEPGAVISTLGKGASTALSEVYSTTNATLVVSNGTVSFDSGTPGMGTISVGAGARLLSEGSIGFSSTGSITIDDTAVLGTRELGLSSASINIGEPDAMAGAVVPAGFNLTQEKIARLLAGDPAEGIPGIETLSLTTSQSLNFFGTVDLSVVDAQTGKADAQLVLNTPAIYGYGSASDVATLTVGTLIWSGVAVSGQSTQSAPPGPVVANGPGTGQGTFDINANQIVFGFPDNVAPDVTTTLNRVMYGFSTVNLTAGEITSNNKNTLAVYQSPGVNPGDPGIGGTLNLFTPLMTGAAGSVMGFTTGGALTATAGSTATTVPSNAGLGAEIDLTAATIDVGNTIMLPSGKLTMSATGDITLQGSANLKLAGQSVSLNDQTVYTWGGDVVLQSANGSITQDAGAVIDVSAVNNTAGSVTFDATNGNVAVNGQIFGSSTAGQSSSGLFSISGQSIGDFAALNAMLDTGGVFGTRSFDIKQGDLIVDGVVKAHSVGISIDNGSLTIDGTIDASGNAPGTIRLAAKDDLTLASSGVLDAHGTVLQVDSYGAPVDAKNKGTIELTSSSGTLNLNDGSTMDVRVTDARNVDGAGNQTVNYGEINLNASRTAETSGDINIQTGNTLNIKGAGSIAVNAVETYSPTDSNGTIVQDNGDTTPVATSGADAGFVGLNQIDTQSVAFINAAYNNDVAAGMLSAVLQTKLAGLLAPKYAAAFHLRPGVEIDGTPSANNPTGKLTVSGDLDLSGFRYGPHADRNPASATYGAGEPGTLVIRANGDLAINGSITDGFSKPPATPDDFGWSLMAAGGVSTALTLPNSAIVGAGTTFPAGSVLGGDITVLGATLPANTAAPVAVTLTNPYVVPAGTPLPVAVSTTVVTGTLTGSQTFAATTIERTSVVTAAPWVVPTGVSAVQYFTNGSSGAVTTVRAGGTVPAGKTVSLVDFLKGTSTIPANVFPSGIPIVVTTNLGKGTIAPSDITLPAGTVLAAGTILTSAVTINSTTTLQANVAIPVAVTLAGGYTIPSDYSGGIVTSAGTFTAGQTIPAGTVLPAGTILPSTDAQITSMIWPAGDPLTFTSAVTTLTNTTLDAGSIIPAGSGLLGVNGASFIAEAGHQLYALGAMLPAGDLSWSMRLVAGADLGAADTRILQPLTQLAGNGNLTLNDPHFGGAAYNQVSFSVLRTGTGDLDLLAGGNFNENSPYGIYTAGTQTVVDSAYLLDRGKGGGFSDPSTVLGSGQSDYEAAIADYQAYYPTGGGDVFVSVQGNLSGNSSSSNLIGNWLWRQGGSIAGQPTAWWINFGTYTPIDVNDPGENLTGFTGIGALGGGNVSIYAGSANATSTASSTGLAVAVGGSGRVLADGTLLQTGGGDLTVKIGGALNSSNAAFIDLRGDISISAGQVGSVNPKYSTGATLDLRANDPLVAETANPTGGIELAPGDGIATVNTRDDLVLGGVANPGLVNQQNTTPFTALVNGVETSFDGKGNSWFSLWTDSTAINLFSAGGNLTPGTQNAQLSALPADEGYTYPASLNVIAASGSIYYSQNANFQKSLTTPIELAPSPNGQLNILAEDSVYGLGVAMSGADPSVLATPFNPGFGSNQFPITDWISNASPNSPAGNQNASPQLFTFGPDTPTGALHANDPDPIRIYAVTGDIVDLGFGEVVTTKGIGGVVTSTSYVGAKQARIIAGRDIIYAGTPTEVPFTNITLGFILNVNPSDVSFISAGRDISYSSMEIAGPGVLDVEAGRNVYLPTVNFTSSVGNITPVGGVFQSIGLLYGLTQANRDGGADIVLTAGVRAAGPDYADFAKLYFNPANQLPSDGTPLDGSGKVAHTYDQELLAWLQQRFGYTGSSSDALAYFLALPTEQQGVFVRQVYFTELELSGREETGAIDSPRQGSYFRGREAIATLFPDQNAQGNPITYTGSITMSGSSGVHTDFGGAIQTLTPGGTTIVGVQGDNPPATAGLITQGSGDIDVYSFGDVLLGRSRIMTTFGGNIVAWSATGDINGGQGSKTTQVFTPPRRVSDIYGNVTLSPQVPSTGAGIATLNPIPEVPPGDIDLVAPLGTIDAGEAGIRVSGNVNLAALQVLNAANIQVQGISTGIPIVQPPNVSGALTASNAAGAAAQQAATPQHGGGPAQPSIIIVEVLGFGGADAPQDDGGPQRKSNDRQSQNLDSSIQVIGAGDLTSEQRQKLTTTEQRNFNAP